MLKSRFYLNSARCRTLRSLRSLACLRSDLQRQFLSPHVLNRRGARV